MEKSKLSRRRFLQVTGAGAATAVLAACGGTADQATITEPTIAPPADLGGEAPAEVTVAPPTDPAEATTEATEGATTEATEGATTEATEAPADGTTAPATGSGTYQESPLLTARVDAGELPAVAERLPTNPLVIDYEWVQPGKYGGTLQLTNSWGGNGISNMFIEFMYGHSPLRWLNDGLEIGPGFVESWESNADTSEWTLHFREGIKWSDGEPFTTADIMYWWEDLVINEEHSDVPPDEARSGLGNLAKFTAVDETTLTLTFDAPAPLTADRLAMWVNAGTGPRWVAPRHYLEQFHPTYNTDIKDFVDHDLKMDRKVNPEVPVLSGWKLVEYNEGTRGRWERNPYYYAVTANGDQLPYMDGAVITGYADKEVEKVNLQAGKVDFTFAGQIALTDVAAMKQNEGQINGAVRFWESGSGSGQAFFLNYDFQQEAMRNLIREPKFRQALSHAFNRDDVHRNYYFGTGEKTTGTFSPKAIEYNFNDEAQTRYVEWRDSYVAFDQEKSKALFEEIGCKAGADGMRTMPDGSPLQVDLVYSATAGAETVSVNELLARDFKAVGVNAQLTPVDPASRGVNWQAGELMSNSDWGIGDGPNHLVYPQWLVPLEPSRWSPLHGKFYELRGTESVNANLEEVAEPDADPWERTPPRIAAEEGSAIQRLWAVYDQTKVEPDAMARHALVWDMMKIHVDEGPFVQGSVANFDRAILVRNDLMNVPTREQLALGGFTDPWIHPTPAVYEPEAWYFDNPEAHA